MLLQIRKLQHELGMGEGELLRLAREVAHDGKMISLSAMTSTQRDQLCALLAALMAHGLEPEHFTA